MKGLGTRDKLLFGVGMGLRSGAPSNLYMYAFRLYEKLLFEYQNTVWENTVCKKCGRAEAPQPPVPGFGVPDL